MPNWLEKTIGFISPALALQRTRARLAGEALLAYEGVRSERRQGGWTTTGTSGNAEMGPALGKLRENARDLARNNSFAGKMVRRRSKRAVGYGITPQADTGDEKLNAVIDGYWRKWVKSCMSDRRMNFYAALQLIVETEFTSGECLVRMYDRRPADGLAVPFQIQLLEPEYLDHAKTESLKDGAYIIHGVQFDSIGRITGYWLFNQHPGEVVTTNRRESASKLIPAETVIHHCQIARPGDVRSVTRMAPIISKIRDIDEYADAEIVRKKVAACMVGMITQPDGGDGPTNGPSAVDANGRKVEEVRPGMFVYGTPGTTMELSSPTDSGDFSAHKKTELREISAGVDMPYVVIGEDLSDVNYSSFRGGAIDERDGIDQYRWNWLIPQVLDPIWEKFIKTLFLMGVVPESSYEVKWNPPPFDLLDRLAEAEADQMELQIGKKSWAGMIGDQGIDPKKHLEQIAGYKKPLEDAGINFFPKAKETAVPVKTSK